jgi:hypothetical protein
VAVEAVPADAPVVTEEAPAAEAAPALEPTSETPAAEEITPTE